MMARGEFSKKETRSSLTFFPPLPPAASFMDCVPVGYRSLGHTHPSIHSIMSHHKQHLSRTYAVGVF